MAKRSPIRLLVRRAGFPSAGEPAPSVELLMTAAAASATFMTATIATSWYALNDQLTKKQLTSRSRELLLSVSRGVGRRLGLQIEDQFRRGIRTGQMTSGAVLPSTRDLAAQLGVSRPVVVEAYAQLAAEGYLSLRPGALPRVAAAAIPIRTRAIPGAAASRRLRFDFRPGLPDLSAFPRTAWLRAARKAMDGMPRRALGYEAPHGCEVLRKVLAEYLGRVRGVVARSEERRVGKEA